MGTWLAQRQRALMRNWLVRRRHALTWDWGAHHLRALMRTSLAWRRRALMWTWLAQRRHALTWDWRAQHQRALMWNWRARRQRAQVVLWFTVAVPLFVSMAGLAIDGGVLLNARRQLQSVADGAARAGATRLDTARLRASGGTDIQLEPTAAQAAARMYVDAALGSEPPGVQGVPRTSVETGERRVHVSIRATLETAFLRIVRIDTVPVEASAFADVQFGIHDGGGG